MKRTLVNLLMILFVLAGCSGCKQSASQKEDLIEVDVTAKYPKKELILQDIMDVEYIPLESSNEFVTMGWLHAVGKEVIIVRNRNRSSDGDIFIFDRNGKALRKINHLGGGGEEYKFLLGVTLDEDNDEIFVNDHWSSKIQVYDLQGNFKRSFKHKEGSQYGMDIYNFDRDHLLCKDVAFDGEGKENKNTFLTISKQDGSVKKEIDIPYEQKVSSIVFLKGGNALMPIRNRTLVPGYDNSWILMDNSSDMIYKLMPDYSMEPVIVRTPAIQSMKPGVFLYPAVFTDRYCFMQTVKAEWDWGTNRGHERVNLMYDKEENAVFEYVLHNADIDNEQPVILTSEVTFGNNEIACVLKLEAHELVEAYGKGQLKGRLKEIASTMDEEANPVIMLVKYKK